MVVDESARKTRIESLLLSQVIHDVVRVAEKSPKDFVAGNPLFRVVVPCSVGVECLVKHSSMLAPTYRALVNVCSERNVQPVVA